MKKIGLLVVVFLTMLFSSARTEETPTWISKIRAWEETIEGRTYVYAIGVADYRDNMTDVEFMQNFQLAVNLAITKLKSYLNVQNLKGFQVIYVWYIDDNNVQKMFLLGAVPKELNKTSSSQPPPPSPPPPSPPTPPSSQDENAAFENAIENSKIITYTKVPDKWWELAEGKNVFRVGCCLYGVGYGKPNSKFKRNPAQYWASAKLAAYKTAQENLASKINNVITNFRGQGNYTEKVNAVLKEAEQVGDYVCDNIYCYTLLKVPLAKIKAIQ